MDDEHSIVLPDSVEDLLRQYQEAQVATNAWKAKAKSLRGQLLDVINSVGYSTASDRLNARPLSGLAGDVPFEVRPKNTERLDVNLLKREHPDVYLSCLKKTASFSFAFLGTNDDE